MGLTILKIRESFPDGPVQTINGRTGEITLAKADVGLTAVDNVADASKPVSTLQQAAIDAVQASADSKRAKPAHNAMGSGTVMLADAVNTKSITGTVTLTHSASTNQTLTRLLLTSTGSFVVNFPSAVRVGGSTIGAIIGLTVPAGTSELSFERVNGVWYLADSVGTTTEVPDTGGGTVATPAFSPGASSYNATQNVTITCGTSGAAIYYTLDGSTPTNASTLYSGPVAISASATLKAIAIKSGMTDSGVQSAAYVIDTVAPTNTGNSINNAGTQLTLTESKVVHFGGGGNGGVTITSDGGAVTGTYLSGSSSTGLVYSLSRTVLSTETVTVSYAQPVTPGIIDAVGNQLANFSNHAVTNNSTSVGGAIIQVSRDMTGTQGGNGLTFGSIAPIHNPSEIDTSVVTWNGSGWEGTELYNSPFIYPAPTGTYIGAGSGSWPVMQWTADRTASGTFTLSGQLIQTGGDVIVIAYKNDVEICRLTLNSDLSVHTIAVGVSMVSGDKFSAVLNPNGSASNDVTAIDFKIE
jgi:hypothetical protein